MISFAVKIPFYEPTFAKYLGVKKKYSITIPVEAEDEVEARKLAIEEFSELARLSSVHWARDIVEDEVVVTIVDNGVN